MGWMNIAHHFNSMHKNLQFDNIKDIYFYLRSFDVMCKKSKIENIYIFKRKTT